MLDHLVAVLLPASALMLVLEGIPYFASPSMAKKFLGFVASRPEWMVRAFGLFLMCAGLAFLWATRQG